MLSTATVSHTYVACTVNYWVSHRAKKTMEEKRTVITPVFETEDPAPLPSVHIIVCSKK